MHSAPHCSTITLGCFFRAKSLLCYSQTVTLGVSCTISQSVAFGPLLVSAGRLVGSPRLIPESHLIAGLTCRPHEERQLIESLYWSVNDLEDGCFNFFFFFPLTCQSELFFKPEPNLIFFGLSALS